MKKIISILMSALLLGCAGTSYKQTNVSMVHPGMGKDDVVSLLGQPNTVITNAGPNEERWVWTKPGTSTSASIVFTNGIVAGDPITSK